MSNEFRKSIHDCAMMITEWERHEFNRIMTSKLPEEIAFTKDDIEREVNSRKRMFGLL